MNKFAIPVILAATVMVAGMFAFIPVEQASTVHTTVQGSQEGVIIRSDNGVNISDNDTVVIDCDNDFILQDTLWSLTDPGRGRER